MALLLVALQTSLEFNGGGLGVFWIVLIALLHIVVSAAVHNDARRRLDQKKPLAFMGPMFWSLAALLAGLAALGLYWVMHYSTLRDKEEHPSHL